MFFYFRIIIAVLIIVNAALPAAFAAEPKEIESITVLSDNRLAVPLSKLASDFSHQSMISVSNVFGQSADQKKKIEDGESADLFITSDSQLIEQLKIKGMVDVNSIGIIGRLNVVSYSGAVVAGESMTPARSFLEYLKSPEAQEIFRKSEAAAP